jgi:hypothetical protein
MHLLRFAAVTVGLPGLLLVFLTATFAGTNESKASESWSSVVVSGASYVDDQEIMDSAEGPNLHVDIEQSERTAVPGRLITLAAEVKLAQDMHVYAPGAKGYKPIQLTIDPMPEMEFKPPVYPQSRIMYFPVLEEHVPVFDGTFRISQDLKVNTSAELWSSLGKDGKMVTITGKLEYQACNTTTCYQPATIPLKWHLLVFPPDHTRAPAETRHK